MDKFETLEDYQNSLKEFNERTRKSYENFIQEHGDDSQKLQLRCTPYTEKKGRYGVASLDFGFQIWQSRQAELDRLNKVLEERTKEWLEAIKLGTYFQEAAKPLKDEVDFLKAQLGIKRDQIKSFESEIKKAWQAVEEKDKRIEAALAIVERFRDKRYPFNVFCNPMEKALRGEQ